MTQNLGTSDLQDTKQTQEQSTAKANKPTDKTKSTQSTIKCPHCGEQILLLPDLKAMENAINRHINQNKNDLQSIGVSIDALKKILYEEVLKAASQQT